MVTQERSGILYILIGPGGVGKNALMEHILADSDDLRQLPTATTRPPRDNEQHGVQHFFVTLDEFRQMIARGDLLEHQEVHPEKFYGVPRHAVEELIAHGQRRIADIDFKGATIIRETYPENTVAIFIAPPSLDALEDRLRERNTSDADIHDRLERVASEMLYAPLSDYVVINDSFEDTIQDLRHLLNANSDPGALGDDVDLRYSVQYVAHVMIASSNAVLVSDNVDQIQFQVEQGDSARETVMKGIADVLNIVPSEDNLKTGFVSNDLVVEMEYEAETRTYTIHYYFTYHLFEDVALPVGWRWASSDESAVIQEG